MSCFICTEPLAEDKIIHFNTCKHTMCLDCVLRLASNETWALTNPRRGAEHEFWKWQASPLRKRGYSNFLEDGLIGGGFADCGCCRKGAGDLMATQLVGPGLDRTKLKDPKRQFRCPFPETCPLSFNWEQETSVVKDYDRLQAAMVRHFRTECKHRIDCPHCAASIALRDISFHLLTKHLRPSRSKSDHFRVINISRPYTVSIPYIDPESGDVYQNTFTLYLPDTAMTQEQVTMFQRDVRRLFTHLVHDEDMPVDDALMQIRQNVRQFQSRILPPI